MKKSNNFYGTFILTDSLNQTKAKGLINLFSWGSTNDRKQVLLATEKIPSSPRYSHTVRRDYLCAQRLEGDCKVRVNQHLGSETLIKWICTPSSNGPLQDPRWWSPGSAERQPPIGANVEEALRRYRGPPAGGLCAAVQAGWATILTVWYGRRGRCTRK